MAQKITGATLSYSVGWNTLCSGALIILGREGVNNYATDDTVDAGLCRTFLPEAISVASSHFDWTFLRKHMSLSPDTTVKSGPSLYAYSLPIDIARLTRVTTANNEDFQIIGRTIWTDSTSCEILYQYLPEFPDALPQNFLTAIKHYLAYLLSKPLSGNDSLASQELQLYQYWIEQASNTDRAYLYNQGETWWTELIDG